MPVKEDAYKIAEIMNGNLEKGGKRIYTQDDFEEQLALAFREYFGIDNVWEISDDNGIVNINDNDIDLQEFENDVRGILSYYGWATIYEGDYEGGITNYEEFDEGSYANEIIKIINDEPWLKKRYPDARDFIFELIEGHNVDDTMTLGEFKDLLNSDFAKEFLGESLKEPKEQKTPEASFNLNKWLAKYETIDGLQGEVVLTAFNKVMAYDVFEDIRKDFDCDVAYLDIVRVPDDYELEQK